MDAGKATVESLFDSKIIYEVPRYQRQYVWELKSQWEPLWEDVKKIAERLVDSAEEKDGEYSFDEKIVPHFMGAVVVKAKNKVSANSAPTWIVVDGQQRLTTILLMMKAMSDVFERIEESAIHAGPLRDFTHNKHFSRVQEEDLVKLRPTGTGYSSFRSLMKVDDKSEEVSDHSDKLGQCYKFYERVTQQWLKQHESELDLAALALRHAVTEKLQVAKIALSANDNEHEIFESLNARGEPLTEFDKSKNHMLHHALNEIGEQDKFYIRYLERFDKNTWWREGHDAGYRSSGNRADVLTWFWIRVMLGGKPINQKAIYQNVRNHIEDMIGQGNSITGVAQSFSQYADAFEELENQEKDHSKLGTYKYRRDTLKTGQFTPVFMTLLTRIESRGIFTNCMQIIDNYLMRRMMFMNVANRFADPVQKLLSIIDDTDDVQHIPKRLIDELMSYGSISNVWPTDGQLAERMLDAWDPKNNVARLVLEEVERSILPSGVAYRDLPRSLLTLEHIMPENWEEHWPLPNRSSDMDRQGRVKSISCIGNFTLLRKGMNSTLSNSSYERKLEYFKSDNLELNKHLVTEYPDVWNEDTIRERGEWILSKVFEIWPHGDALKQRFKIK